jgi:hypothetical protein
MLRPARWLGWRDFRQTKGSSCDMGMWLTPRYRATLLIMWICIYFLLHELPVTITEHVLDEAHRILKPGGCIGILEMDPESLGYNGRSQGKVRVFTIRHTQRYCNYWWTYRPWLFAIVKSTEPYLGKYFDIAPMLHQKLLNAGFSVVRVASASDKHFAVVAFKKCYTDLRCACQNIADACVWVTTRAGRATTKWFHFIYDI